MHTRQASCISYANKAFSLSQCNLLHKYKNKFTWVLELIRRLFVDSHSIEWKNGL